MSSAGSRSAASLLLPARAVGTAVARVAPVPDPAGMTVMQAGDHLEAVTFVEQNLRGTVTFARNAGTYRLLSITYRPGSGAR